MDVTKQKEGYREMNAQFTDGTGKAHKIKATYSIWFHTEDRHVFVTTPNRESLRWEGVPGSSTKQPLSGDTATFKQVVVLLAHALGLGFEKIDQPNPKLVGYRFTK